MREIIFRGKRKDTGELVYGDLCHSGKEHIHIVPFDAESEDNAFEVFPETVGQYTGLQANGVKIFEGDIIRVFYFGMGLGENLGVFETEEEITGVIEYGDLGLLIKKISDKNGKWRTYTGYEQGEGNCEIAYLHDVYEDGCADYDFEVIGKIHDNPELLNKEGV